VISATDDVMRQLTALQNQLRRPAGAAGDGAQADTTAAANAASKGVLAEVEGTLKDLKQFRDSVLARPLAGLGYRQYPRLREEVQTVSRMISQPLMQPTAGEMLRLGELKTETDQAQARLDGIIDTRVARINKELSGSPHIVPPTRARFVP